MAKFDALWVANRTRYRKTIKGSRMRLDDVTGYLEPSHRRGFSAEMKKTFIARFKVCSNMTAIAKSVNIDLQAIYDAIAIDPKFRADIQKCNENTQRSKQLNSEMEKLAVSEKVQVITDLAKAAEKYHGKLL